MHKDACFLAVFGKQLPCGQSQMGERDSPEHTATNSFSSRESLYVSEPGLTTAHEERMAMKSPTYV